MTQLTILGTNIRQDAEGRYCLNDCHRASGGEASKAPGQWMANKQTKALMAEMDTVENSTVSETAGKSVVTIEGRNGGTYAAKELVYAYAMWINPAFHLKVIRAFDAMVSGKGPLTVQTLSREQKINEAFLLSQDIIREKDEEIAVLRPQAEALKVITEADSDLGVRDAGRELQIGQNRVVDFCLKHGWACREGGKLKAAHYGLTKKYCRMCAAPYTDRFTGETKVREDFRLTRKGIERIAYHLAKQLTANREKQAQIAREMELH
ncbi:MAG: KilA-N domain-containing protein [Gluconobacter sp.]|uniref:KilA-N domain-containing protein n=1 Tax=Gluconobacter sp. TaxID=1876758 RepID=UPI0039E8C7C5